MSGPPRGVSIGGYEVEVPRYERETALRELCSRKGPDLIQLRVVVAHIHINIQDGCATLTKRREEHRQRIAAEGWGQGDLFRIVVGEGSIIYKDSYTCGLRGARGVEGPFRADVEASAEVLIVRG